MASVVFAKVEAKLGQENVSVLEFIEADKGGKVRIVVKNESHVIELPLEGSINSSHGSTNFLATNGVKSSSCR